ncbi:MAG: hypothetical protein IJT65_06510 [Eubacterium sp.]|nr:hypothetical protein [Eubacterium sp.]
MQKRFSALAFVLLIMLSFSSCTGIESNKIMHNVIVQAAGLDYENGKYLLTLQYLDLTRAASKSEGASGVLTKTANARGNTIKKAFSEAERVVFDRLFLGQIKLIVINSSLLENKREELCTFLLENREIRENALICTGSKSAKSIIENPERGDRVPAESVCRQLLISEKKNYCRVFTVNDYINTVSQNKKPPLPVIEAKKEYCRVLRR